MSNEETRITFAVDNAFQFYTGCKSIIDDYQQKYKIGDGVFPFKIIHDKELTLSGPSVIAFGNEKTGVFFNISKVESGTNSALQLMELKCKIINHSASSQFNRANLDSNYKTSLRTFGMLEKLIDFFEDKCELQTINIINPLLVNYDCNEPLTKSIVQVNSIELLDMLKEYLDNTNHIMQDLHEGKRYIEIANEKYSTLTLRDHPEFYKLSGLEQKFAEVFAAAIHEDWYFNRLEEMKTDPDVIAEAKLHVSNKYTLEEAISDFAHNKAYNMIQNFTSWDMLPDNERAASISKAEETIKMLKESGLDIHGSLLNRSPNLTTQLKQFDDYFPILIPNESLPETEEEYHKYVTHIIVETYDRVMRWQQDTALYEDLPVNMHSWARFVDDVMSENHSVSEIDYRNVFMDTLLQTTGIEENYKEYWKNYISNSSEQEIDNSYSFSTVSKPENDKRRYENLLLPDSILEAKEKEQELIDTIRTKFQLTKLKPLSEMDHVILAKNINGYNIHLVKRPEMGYDHQLIAIDKYQREHPLSTAIYHEMKKNENNAINKQDPSHKIVNACKKAVDITIRRENNLKKYQDFNKVPKKKLNEEIKIK